MGGSTFWDPVPKDNCEAEKYSSFGLGQKIVDQDEKVLYTLTTSDITFTFNALPRINVCGHILIRTEHPRLLICEIIPGNVRARKVDVAEMDLMAYTNSKFIYVERHMRRQLQHLYYDGITRKYNLEREMLKNRLRNALNAPDELAYQLMKGPGFMAVLAGEVHIIKCIPKEVKVLHLKEYYNQLPVYEGNNTYFMAPRTHISMKKATQITCNKTVPPMYFIDENWYKFTPGPEEVLAPIKIAPQTVITIMQSLWESVQHLIWTSYENMSCTQQSSQPFSTH